MGGGGRGGVGGGGESEQGGQKARSARRRGVGGVDGREVAPGLAEGEGERGWQTWQKARWRREGVGSAEGLGQARESASMASTMVFQQGWQTKWRQLKTTIRGMFSDMGGSLRQSMQRVDGRGRRWRVAITVGGGGGVEKSSGGIGWRGGGGDGAATAASLVGVAGVAKGGGGAALPMT